MKRQLITAESVLARATAFTIRGGRAGGTTLLAGEWFRLRREPGQVFRFHHHTRSPSGGEWISAYGGAKDPRGDVKWRAFFVSDEFVPCKAPRAPADRKDQHQ